MTKSTSVTDQKSKGSVYFSESLTDGVLILSFINHDKEMNVLSRSVLEELDSKLDEIPRRKDVKGLVIISGRDDQFIAGADISDIEKLTTVELATNGAKSMQAIFQKIHLLEIPSVAAINGACLGGGLELSLSCSYRIVSNDEKTKLGLPEIQLGFIPGAGGTQRLPRLIGLQSGLDLILTGKRIDGQKALKLGLADACVHPTQLRDVALTFAKKTKVVKKYEAKSAANWALEQNFVGRKVMRQKATSTVLEKTKGFYPASTKAIEVVFDGFELSLEKGLDLEAKAFGELVQTSVSQSLVHLFHATTAIKKHPYKDAGLAKFSDVPLSHIGIIGGGFMGGGIANVCADRGLRVSVSDPNKASISRLLSSTRSYFSKQVKRKKLKNFAAESKIAHIQPFLSPIGFEKCDVVIEAVFEDLGLKQKILAGLESNASENWVFASNTSALPISEIAAKSKKPERVLGMHFFSPVEKMPLLEIVKTKQTADWAVARALEVGARMGKTLIVVKDSPGFFTTRILAIYLAEAALMLGEGYPIEYIDNALVKFGWPVGPLTLIDEVGIDVGLHVMETMSAAWPDRFIVAPQFKPIKDSGRLGRKNGKGFFLYADQKKQGPDDAIYKLIGTSPKPIATPEEIAERLTLTFINESVRCLEEGIIASAYDGDIGAIFGLGFPPFLGGPFKYIDHLSAEVVVSKLKELSIKFGPRFSPCRMLIEAAEKKTLFFPGEQIRH